MTQYLPDTNVLVKAAKNTALADQLVSLPEKRNCRFVASPVSLLELVVGLIKGSEAYFADNKRVFKILDSIRAEILELPIPFALSVLWKAQATGHHVEAADYVRLMRAIKASESKDEFFEKAESCGWQDIEKQPEIHEAEISKELQFLRKLARQNSKKTLAQKLAARLSHNGQTPDPEEVHRRFSAALEYLHTKAKEIQHGSKPEKNDRGVLMDFNLLLYLADSEIYLLPCEQFIKWVKTSEQVSRIIAPSKLLNETS